jgi:hypothetical protein
MNSPPIDYGNQHPYELMERHRQLSFHDDWYSQFYSIDDYFHDDWYDDDDTYNDPNNIPLDETPTPPSLKFNYDFFRPIRIKLDTRHLPSDDDDLTEFKKREFLEYTVLPIAAQFWTKALMVFPVKRLFVDDANCPLAKPSQSIYGVTGADIIVYITKNQSCGDDPDAVDSIAGSDSCDWDQYDRPTVGVLDICYNSFQLNSDGTASDETKKIMINVAIHELGHILGLRSKDMAFYYNPKNGKPRTPRPVKPSTDTRCITGTYTSELKDPIYRPSHTTLREGAWSPGIRFFEVVTPTVRSVARNHFNCDRMRGMRLENQPTAGDCFGDHWEERLAWDESMSAVLTPSSIPEHLSPFTLALLQDTGWYRANFTMAKVMSFGHGAGCDFVEQPCIVNGTVPEYSEGYFCNTTDRSSDFDCDPSHNMIGVCDLYDLSTQPNQKFPPVPLVYRYFDNPAYGPLRYQRTDFCPLYSSNVLSCNKPLSPKFQNMFQFPEETFGDQSRCFKSTYARPLCLESYCSEEENAVLIRLGESDVICPHDGATIMVSNSTEAGEIFVTCPRKANICPELICPANCSGQGDCIWNSTTPYCKCYDEKITSAHCSHYEVIPKSELALQYDKNKDNSVDDGFSKNPDSSSLQNSLSRWVYLMSVLITIVLML